MQRSALGRPPRLVPSLIASVIPFYLIQVRQYAPAAAGAVFLPLIALMFLFSARVGALIPRVGERLLLFAGAALAGTGFAAFALLDELHGYALSVLPAVLLLGCGMTLSRRAAHQCSHVFGAGA